MLLLDTSRSRPSLFLSYGERLLSASPDSDSFLLPCIADLLQEHSLSLANLSALAIGTGPGRFAATRSGVALFSSLALAARLPLLSFPSPSPLPTPPNRPFSLRHRPQERPPHRPLRQNRKRSPRRTLPSPLHHPRGAPRDYPHHRHPRPDAGRDKPPRPPKPPGPPSAPLGKTLLRADVQRNP